jgi:biotin carboxyl carrier protein/thiol-disulfide isomerase/thioredoxin
MAQSGNRPPRRSQPTKSGSRSPSSTGPADGNGHDGNGQDESAAERARERLAQRSVSGQKHQTASQRARSAPPASPKTKAQAAAAQRARAGGPASRRGSTRRPQQRSTAMTAAIFGTVLVVLAVLVIVLVSVTGGKGKTPGLGFGMKSAPASVVTAISDVSPSAFAAAGSVVGSSGPYTQGLSVLKKQPVLKEGGKPLVLYVGSNYCPYCAATRWPLAVALARFGTFKNLKITASGQASTEPYPATNSLSFYHVTYESPYIAFSSTEQCTDIVSSSTTAAVEDCSGYLPLENLTGTPLKIFAKYDFKPYQTAANEGGIPFIDFGNRLVEDGASMDPTILGGFSHAQIAASLNNPVASPGQTILVGANYYTAEICKMTGDKPGSVCDMPVVKQAGAALAKL